MEAADRSTKEQGEAEQQSFFYVLWPDDKSPSTSTTSGSATSFCNNAATAAHSSPAALPTFSYETHYTSAGSNGGASSSNAGQLQSPVASPPSKQLQGQPAVRMASNSMTSSSVSQNQAMHDRINSDASPGVLTTGPGVLTAGMKSQILQHTSTGLPTSMPISTTSLFPSLDSSTTTTSIGRHKILPVSDFATYNRKQRNQASGGDLNLREIGKTTSLPSTC